MNRKLFNPSIIFLLSAIIVSSCSNTIEVDTTDNYELVELPDGSMIYLNRNSSVSYNQDFEPRKVSLQGEGYFDVVYEKSPFTVTTDLGEIEVIGTEFNLKSDNEELEVQVTKGEVKLLTEEEKNNIKRGQKAVFNKAEGSVKKAKADLEFDKWMKDMRIEFRRLGRDIDKQAHKFEKNAEKFGNQIKKEAEKLK
jgi:transmembrane sensor